MTVRIFETNEEREIAIFDHNHIDCTADLIADDKGVYYSRKYDIYIMRKESYEYWVKYADLYSKIVAKFYDELDAEEREEVREIFNHTVFDCDDLEASRQQLRIIDEYLDWKGGML